ncbi:MAG: ABC transporter ATP-binding protein [Planctomycetia bacterium]|jgi:iron complex transport system ATP-binding protein
MNTDRPSPILDVRGFSCAIGGKSIVRDVTFSVQRGESVAIIGPNGAGKTTLLKCIDGILPGVGGEIQIDGRPIADYSRKELAKRISYVPQADGYTLPFTVEQFVQMARYPYLSPFHPVGRDQIEVVRQVMEQTDISQFADRVLDTLSGGERQTVFLAAAVAQESPIMLLDEPTAFLDYRHQDEIRQLLAEIAGQSDLTTVCVTHDVNRAAMENDRVIALREGQIVFDGQPEALMNEATLESIYACRFMLIDRPDIPLPMVVPLKH